MKKSILTLAFAVFSLFLMAEEPPNWGLKKGAFGLGVWPTLNFRNVNLDTFGSDASTISTGLGLSGRYAFTDAFQLEALVGFSSSKTEYTSQTGMVLGNIKRSGINTGLTALVSKKVIESGQHALVLSPFLGINLFSGTNTFTPASGPSNKEDISNLRFDLGIRPEWFFHAFQKVHMSVGLRLDFISASTETQEVAGTLNRKESITNINVFGDNMIGGLGFTFWW